jgi:hypothetical protein
LCCLREREKRSGSFCAQHPKGLRQMGPDSFQKSFEAHMSLVGIAKEKSSRCANRCVCYRTKVICPCCTITYVLQLGGQNDTPPRAGAGKCSRGDFIWNLFDDAKGRSELQNHGSEVELRPPTCSSDRPAPAAVRAVYNQGLPTPMRDHDDYQAVADVTTNVRKPTGRESSHGGRGTIL